MVKDKAKFLLLFVGIPLIIGFYGFSVYTNSKAYIANKDLSHDELTKCIDLYWFQGKPINFTIELEKDVDDLHLLLLSYRQDTNSNKQTGLAVFKRLANGKYRYEIFQQSSTIVITTNKGAKDEKNYGVFSGMITENQLTKYLITVHGGKEFTDTIEKNKYFIRVYDLNKQTGFGMRPVYN